MVHLEALRVRGSDRASRYRRYMSTRPVAIEQLFYTDTRFLKMSEVNSD